MLISTVQWQDSVTSCCSVAKLGLTVCDPVDCNTTDFPLLHCLLEFVQIHVHWVSDSIQPSLSLSPPPPALNLAHPESFLMTWIFASSGQSSATSSSTSVLPLNTQDWFPLRLTGLISLQSKGLSRVFSSTTVQKHQFFGARPSLWWATVHGVTEIQIWLSN